MQLLLSSYLNNAPYKLQAGLILRLNLEMRRELELTLLNIHVLEHFASKCYLPSDDTFENKLFRFEITKPN